MSIKSDNWIKKMSTENDMISPFQPNQVKINEDSNENATVKDLEPIIQVHMCIHMYVHIHYY